MESTSRVPSPTDAAPRWAIWSILAICTLFILISLAFIPMLGIQYDEALFGYVPFSPRWTDKLDVFGQEFPVMLMSYVGALKGYLYVRIFKWFYPNVYSLRLPMVLAGTWTLWIVYALLKRSVSWRAGMIAMLLLATDSAYLLTTCFDWGPVALQHLCLWSGMLLILIFHQSGRPAPLALGAFCLGLGFWDKALFIWLLTGVGAAALLVFPRQIWSRCTARYVAIASLAFALGCAPLIAYNVVYDMKTFRGNASFSSEQFQGKVLAMKYALDGRGLLGYLAAFPDGGAPAPPRNVFERSAVSLNALFHAPNRTGLFAACVLSLAVLPFMRRTRFFRPAIFAVLALLFSWMQMVFTRNAGASTHHTVLVWPFPHVLVACVLAALIERGRAAGALALIVAAFLLTSQLVMLNEHYAFITQYGSSIPWTDAFFPLAGYVKQYAKEHGPIRFYATDWGISNPLMIAVRGRIPIEQDLALAEPIPTAVFIGHVANRRIFPDQSRAWDEEATKMGYRKNVIGTVPDKRGQPIFEVFRFVPGRNPLRGSALTK